MNLSIVVPNSDMLALINGLKPGDDLGCLVLADYLGECGYYEQEESIRKWINVTKPRLIEHLNDTDLRGNWALNRICKRLIRREAEADLAWRLAVFNLVYTLCNPGEQLIALEMDTYGILCNFNPKVLNPAWRRLYSALKMYRDLTDPLSIEMYMEDIVNYIGAITLQYNDNVNLLWKIVYYLENP